ncbi:squalene--hopene cyclase [Bacillus sp. FJAT-47783]|uniref:squalene--hopene cyclase n=1 Tax=Bacillus sp. FJAT-47783 TaxID=2922712 RepID=UPI001FAC771A|nr:squalene--hopene cyclase [Bacillus sp. FJAT-47783]
MRQQIESEINRMVASIIKSQNVNGSWDFPFETGVATDCYMIILLQTLEIDDEDLILSLVERILSKQEENGAWKLFYDEENGNLSLTVEAYYALLYSGVINKDNPKIRLAKEFILNHGGIKQVNMFTKVMLALTGQMKWPKSFPLPIEFILFPSSFPLNFFDLSIYARANLTPILIVADKRFSVKTTHTPDISDLYVKRSQDSWNMNSREWRSFHHYIYEGVKRLVGIPFQLHQLALNRAEQYMLHRIEQDGTFYSYFSATFLMIFALMARGYSRRNPIIVRAVQGLKSFKTTIDGHTHIQYTTATVWNTALLSYSMQEAGVSSTSVSIQRANHYLLTRQHFLYGDWAVHNSKQLPGGWGFSNINTINPDIDDTTASLRAIRTQVKNELPYRQRWDLAIQWVLSMQNDDGGWGAFEKNVDKPIFSLLPVEGGEKMLLDPSTPDLTGRTLQFFGDFTKSSYNQTFIKEGVKWLLKKQRSDGSWYGRWGICYIYGTWSALTGLISVKVRSDHPSIRKAVKWLYSIQNEDGGWGESCKSDKEKRYISLPASTRVHTAWALDALVAAEESITPQIEKAVNYLLNPKAETSWAKNYPKGQGLPGSFYIHYPSYEYIFPLIALSHYQKKMYDA